MKIAVIGNTADTMLNFRGSLLRSLGMEGHDVYALCPDFTAETRAAVETIGAVPIDYKLDRSGINPLQELASIGSLYAELRTIQADAILCYFIKPSVYGMVAGRLAGVPRRVALIEGLGYSFDTAARSFARRLVRWASRWLLRVGLGFADRILVLNDDDRRELTKTCALPPTRIQTVGGIGVKLDQLRPTPVREHATTFVMAARLIAEKGVREYVEAARRLKARHPAARFILLGTVDQNPHSLGADEIESWAGAGVVEWPGHVADVGVWLHDADVFVLPSYYREGVPRSIQEAMACALPIVTTDSVGCRDTVEPGRNGFLVPPRNVDALSAAMERYLTTPGLARRMGKASRTIAEKRFDAAAFDRRMINLLVAPDLATIGHARPD